MRIPLPAAHGPSSEACYADVIVPRHLTGPFTYIVPAELQSSLSVGHRVLVPFGQSVLPGAVTAVMRILPRGLDRARLKEIRGLVQEGHSTKVPVTLLDLSRRIAEQYIAPWGQCLRLVLPPPYLSEAERPRKKAGPPASTQPEPRLLLHGPSSVPTPADLPPMWQDQLREAIHRPAPSRVLVQAPWLTRLALLREMVGLTMAQGKSVLVIVGETEKSEGLADALRRSTEGSVACYHSGLPSDVRARIWEQVNHNTVRAVVGTRSAIFLPVQGMGLVWVDEEEDPALKEPQEPRYHARDVAWIRAQDERALLMLGSSHPSVETIEQVEHGGSVLRQSPSLETRPAVQVIDLRQHEKGISLSLPLVQAIRASLDQQAGAVLFLNRKGYGGALVCRDCGMVPRCEACGVARSYSRQAARLTCAYCRNSTPVPVICPACTGPRLSVVGEGTERVEEEARRLFPSARILRIDGDTIKRPSQAKVIWNNVQEHKWDLLVGTQLLFRGGAIPPVGVVGVVQADAGLSVPDFRSAERTYHTLLDAVDLARPASVGGTVIIQTYLPTHHAVQAVAEHDESRFTSIELSHRVALGYPPAVHLMALHVSGVREHMVQEAATAWVARLTACVASAEKSKGQIAKTNVDDRIGPLTVLGPAPAPVSRLRGRYRWQILIKATDRERALRAIRQSVEEMEQSSKRRSVKFDVDVDPIEMR